MGPMLRLPGAPSEVAARRRAAAAGRLREKIGIERGVERAPADRSVATGAEVVEEARLERLVRVSPGENVISSRCQRGKFEPLRLAVVGECRTMGRPPGMLKCAEPSVAERAPCRGCAAARRPCRRRRTRCSPPPPRGRHVGRQVLVDVEARRSGLDRRGPWACSGRGATRGRGMSSTVTSALAVTRVDGRVPVRLVRRRGEDPLVRLRVDRDGVDLRGARAAEELRLRARRGRARRDRSRRRTSPGRRAPKLTSIFPSGAARARVRAVGSRHAPWSECRKEVGSIDVGEFGIDDARIDQVVARRSCS